MDAALLATLLLGGAGLLPWLSDQMARSSELRARRRELYVEAIVYLGPIADLCSRAHARLHGRTLPPLADVDRLNQRDIHLSARMWLLASPDVYLAWVLTEVWLATLLSAEVDSDKIWPESDEELLIKAQAANDAFVTVCRRDILPLWRRRRAMPRMSRILEALDSPA